MIRKIFRLKVATICHLHISQSMIWQPFQTVTCETSFNGDHLLFECKNLQLLQNNLRAMITKTLSFHYHNSQRINLELLLGEGDTFFEVALEIRYLLCEFPSLSDIQHTEY